VRGEKTSVPVAPGSPRPSPATPPHATMAVCGTRRGTSGLPATAAPWDGARASRHRTRHTGPCSPHGAGPGASNHPASPTGRPAALDRAGNEAGATRAWSEDVRHWPASSVCPRPLPSRAPWTGSVPSGFLLEYGMASALCPWQAGHDRWPWDVFLCLSSTPQASNAAPQPLPEAGARDERRLEAVGCRRLFGAACG
jgi:hypothetical protein